MNVTFKDVQDAYEGRLSADREAWVMAKVAEAHRLLNGLCPKASRITDDHPRAGLLRDAVIRAVLRVVRDENPALKSESEDGYSYTKDSLVSSGNLWFPDADLRALGCGAGPRVGSVKTRPDPLYAGLSRRRVARGRWW